MGNGKNAWEPGETAREKAKAYFFLTIAAPRNICNLKKALENQHVVQTKESDSFTRQRMTYVCMAIYCTYI